MEIGFSLGSNMYNRKRLLMQAKNLLSTAPRTQFLTQSPIYETTPHEVSNPEDHPPYLNAVVLFESDLPLQSWISYIGKIEKNLGRVRTQTPNEPRPIDIDIIYADDQVLENPELQIPHPRWAERRFVVQPLCDIRPQLVLPGVRQSTQQILRTLPPDEAMHLFEERW
jgi:2-amino-4-hydroxy-6-hydroxymethyldihydropteridine diphosphokinase